MTRTSNSVHLCQQKYIQDLLTRIDMLDCKASSTPMASTTSLSLYDGESLSDATPYRQIVGALQYYTVTCPDISFVVSEVCQFMHAPTIAHCYLRGIPTHGLTFQASADFTLSCFTDAD